MRQAQVSTTTSKFSNSRHYIEQLELLFVGRDGDPSTKLYSSVWKRLREQGTHYDQWDVKRSKAIRKTYGMQNRECYSNAQKLAEEGYQYVEGVAMMLIPTEHAWVVDPKHPEIVIDPTWCLMKGTTEPDYFGVAMDLDFIHRCQRRTETYGPLFKAWLLRDHPEFKKDIRRMLYL
jgi:hypothetical protein